MLAPWKKSYDQPRQHIKKQRHYFGNKGSSSQSYDFSNGHVRIHAFKLWCWRRLLRVPWAARRSNQSILKEISPECSLEGLMLKLKLQYFGHLMRRVDSLELGQHKRHPEFPVVTRESRRNSGKTTWFPRHRKMKPFPATASQEKSYVRNWWSKRYLAPLMRPQSSPASRSPWRGTPRFSGTTSSEPLLPS